MKHHHKFGEASTLVNAGIPVLLTGEKGSGKTTIGIHIAEHLGLKFYSMSMTRQTTLSHLLGFMSVTGDYVSTTLREAAEFGGLYLLDELDAADVNVVLCLNTIENGYISFPTGILKCHPDFRLMATANPQDQHENYTGRAKLDAATLDRFDIIHVDRDSDLEQELVDADTYRKISVMREALKSTNSSVCVSMRDSMRYQKRKDLGLLDGFMERIAGNSPLVIDAYEKRLENLPKHADQSECKTFDDLVDLVSLQCRDDQKEDFPF